MKLTPAKCPSCGAAIEVNPKLEKTICQYCGTTVFVEEAVQKLKVELSGKVEVEGIKTDKKRLEEAKKHMRLKEYDSARRLLEEILQNDHFHIEAKCEWIRAMLLGNQLTKGCISPASIRLDEEEKWRLIEQILSEFDKMVELDEEKEYQKYLTDELPVLDYLRQEDNRLKENENTCRQLSEQLNQSIRSYGGQYIEDAIYILCQEFEISYGDLERYTKGDYETTSLKIHRNGTISWPHQFDRYSDIYVLEGKPKHPLSDMKELQEKLNHYIDVLTTNKKKKQRGRTFDKARRKNMSMMDKVEEDASKLGSKMKRIVLLILSCVIFGFILLMVIACTIMVFKTPGSKRLLTIVIMSAIGIPSAIGLVRRIKLLIKEFQRKG